MSIRTTGESQGNNVKNTEGKKKNSSRARFLFGAGLGIAVSIPIFAGVDSPPVKAFLMLAFAGLMGGGQVLGGRDTAGGRKFTRWAMIGGVGTMVIGIVLFMLLT